MGIYIPGMKMPKACVYRENGHVITCPLYDVDGYCGALNKEAKHDLESKLLDCPLILVSNHGRLIDADSMEKEVCGGCVHGEHKYANCIDCALANAPTIIMAEPPKEETE